MRASPARTAEVRISGSPVSSVSSSSGRPSRVIRVRATSVPGRSRARPRTTRSPSRTRPERPISNRAVRRRQAPVATMSGSPSQTSRPPAPISTVTRMTAGPPPCTSWASVAASSTRSRAAPVPTTTDSSTSSPASTDALLWTSATRAAPDAPAGCAAATARSRQFLDHRAVALEPGADPHAAVHACSCACSCSCVWGAGGPGSTVVRVPARQRSSWVRTHPLNRSIDRPSRRLTATTSRVPR